MVRERAHSAELARGVVLVLFGVTVLTVPGGFFTLMLRIFGFVALLDGVLALVGLLRERVSPARSEWKLAVEGVAGIGAGLLTIWWPALTAFVLFTIVGVWVFLTGAAELFSALEESGRSRKVLGVLRAVLGIGFGVLLLAHPVASGTMMIIVLGCYAIAMGVTQIGTGVVARRLPS